MASITLFGSTGLIGNEILKLLEKDDYFKNINVISRREIKLKSKKTKLKLNLKLLVSLLKVICKLHHLLYVLQYKEHRHHPL